MTRTELAKFDGRAGRAAYVAVNGTIYDVSASPLWKDGDHQGMHQAGAELGEALKSAPHVRAVVERFPVVGHLEEDAAPVKAASGGKGLVIGVIVAAIVLLAVLLSR